MVDLGPSKYEGVFSDGRDFFTRNLVPGASVYGEKLVTHDGVEYRRWDPYRSKLVALLHKGCPAWPFRRDSEVLYLGAASGTTASHVSDVCASGRVYCVEISARVFRKLIDVSSQRPNMLPFLGDADRPDAYRNLLRSADVVYQDIAQRDQLSIFVKNLSFLAEGGIAFLMVKARSVDVAASPPEIYRAIAGELSSRGCEVLATVELDPLEKDHAAIVMRKRPGQA